MSRDGWTIGVDREPLWWTGDRIHRIGFIVCAHHQPLTDHTCHGCAALIPDRDNPPPTRASKAALRARTRASNPASASTGASTPEG